MPQLPSMAPAVETVQPPTPAMSKPTPIPHKPIEVEALSIGFYDNHRKNGGDRFTVPSIDMTGSWMRCLDPVHEKARLERLAKKRKKANSAED